MSNLLKALKRAERDRQAALEAKQAGTQPEAPVETLVSAVADHVTPQERTSGQPAVVRRQRDAAKQPARPAAASAEPSYSPSRYPGVMVSVALAVAFAFGVKTWIDSQEKIDHGAIAAKPVDNIATPAPSAAKSTGGNESASALPAPTRIPAALNVEAAGPMQLRLDRTLDKAAAASPDRAVK